MDFNSQFWVFWKKLESFDLYLISNIDKSVGLVTINYLAKVEDYPSAGYLCLSGMVEMVVVVVDNRIADKTS